MGRYVDRLTGELEDGQIDGKKGGRGCRADQVGTGYWALVLPFYKTRCLETTRRGGRQGIRGIERIDENIWM